MLLVGRARFLGAIVNGDSHEGRFVQASVRERVPCPNRQRLLTQRTLRWRHHCKTHKPLSEEHAALHKQMLVERVGSKLMHRMGKLDEIPTAGELRC